MLNFKGTIVSALLIGASIISQSALATPSAGIEATLTGYEFSSKKNVVDVNVDLKGSGLFGWWGGVSGDVAAGAYSGTWSNGDSFAAFCVELTQNFRTFGKSAVYTEGTFSSTVESNLTNLANKYYSFVDDAISSAAFQVAVWEIVSEKSDNLNLDKGKFEADPVWNGFLWFGSYDAESKAAISLAKTWLSGVNDDSILATGDYSLTYLKNKNYQDLVVFTSIAAVPEPATYGMLLLGMGVVALVARRRRGESIRF
ncbi:PEP-CTERM sorting domain-containing protein [Methylobacillus arboreus]|uniref:PEP-CTERM sorting domain-containing protein n=1 Tax=Methylobacillus arboreus TaxID=755170 RepID=UPI001E559919|nr:PEP-CTERM sorting domain-containing protein [Methylobacillus arboreus]MCB5190305.1 PEP-CTERM sorting domain-containing protein [Methylobacillus arboreus]